MSLLFNIDKGEGEDRFKAKPINQQDINDTANYNSSTNGVPGQGKTLSVSTRSISNKSSKSTIDVISQFRWSASNINEEIVKFPHIVVKEYYLTKSTLAHQLAYYAEAGGQASLQNLKVATDFVGLAGNDINEALKDKSKGIAAAMRDATRGGRNLLGLKGSITESETLEMYYNMYPTCPTGFDYRFPYYSDKHSGRSSTWDSSFKGVGENAITSFSTNIIEGTRKNATDQSFVGALYSEPGVFVERSKYYQPTEGEAISFSFPLLNTFTNDDVQKNFDLIWLLTFQNTPFRKNKSLLEPPCMYELLIPGVKYVMYAVMESLNIDFIGTRREIDLQIPAATSGGRVTKKIIVPEAYNVSIVFKALTTDSSNLLIEAINKS